MTLPRTLSENCGCSFIGTSKKASFEIEGELARAWLALPNPHGRPNSDVLVPWASRIDFIRRTSDTWIIDFGATLTEEQAALYQKPFQYVVEFVKPERLAKTDANLRTYWWRFGRPRLEMRCAIAGLPRCIVTPEVSRPRLFAFLPAKVLPDQKLVVIARDDDTTFGILSSRFHAVWAMQMGLSQGSNTSRYTGSACFETFPFPRGLSPSERGDSRFIAMAARDLNLLRDAWLNPTLWVGTETSPEEQAAGFPLRLVARRGHEAEVRARTLAALYNERPCWLDRAHRRLDAAVADAYGWSDYSHEIEDEEILRRLLALNAERTQDGMTHD